MGGLFRRLLLLFAIAAAGGLAALAASYWHLMAWADQPMSDQDMVIELQPGDTLDDVLDHLAAQGFEARLRLQVLTRLTGVDKTMQAGEYRIEVGESPQQLLQKLRTGEVITYEFRIEEGLTIGVVLQQMRSNPYLAIDIEATDASALRAELSLDAPFAEGMFFPDTYYIHRGDSARALLLRAYANMRARMDAVWPTRDPDSLLKSPYDMVILASIIEKETGRESDRAQISQVFHKRLAERMLLQTDPTVIYALGASFDGNLTRAHLRIDSPFNTYRYRGLPPTPIALPSAASIVAAAQPAEGDYLYFVAKGDGASQFSRTLAEHNSAVRQYQLNPSSR